MCSFGRPASGLRWSRRNGSHAFAIGLAVNNKLVSAVAEAIQSALAEHRIIKDRHPFFNAAVGGQNRRAAGVPFDQQIIEVGSGLACAEQRAVQEG